jgi:hypothetical protein
LIDALDWARGEMLKEVAETLAELGIPKGEALRVCYKVLAKLDVPEEGRELATSLLAFVGRRLAAVFKSGESRHCWRRATFIAGHALAGHATLPKRGWLPEDSIEALRDALEPCAMDTYLTTDGEIPPLSTSVVGYLYYIEVPYARDLSQIRKIRERLGVLTPHADTDIIKAVKETAEKLMKRWRKRDFDDHEAFYALGLAALAAGVEVDNETADLLLYAASAAVQVVARPADVLPVLAALRPLGEKAPHRYVSLLAAASELETLDQETSRYIYGALQQLKNRLLEVGRRWPLVHAINAYSNLLRRHLGHIWGRWEETVADMCQLYGEVRRRSAAATSESNLSAQHLFSAVAGAHVLAVALGRDELTPLV